MLIPPGGSGNISTYWNAIRAGNPTHIQMDFSAQNVILDDSDISGSDGVTLTDILNSDSKLTVGKAVCKQLTAKIIVTDKTRNLRWKDRFALRFGVEISGTTNWITLGYYNGKKPKNIRDASEVEFIAYDDMYKFDIDADDFIESLHYPIKPEPLFRAACAYVGVKALSTPIEPMTVWDTEFSKADLSNFMTLRDILEAIAEATCTYVKMLFNDYCGFVWFENNTSLITISRSDEFALEREEQYDAYTWDEFDTNTWNNYAITTWDNITNADQMNYVIEGVYINYNGTGMEWPNSLDRKTQNIYKIIDNVFVKGMDQSLIRWLYNRLHGAGEQIPISVECVGNWMLESGDIIKVKTDSNKTVKLPIYSRTLRWAGYPIDILEIKGE